MNNTICYQYRCETRRGEFTGYSFAEILFNPNDAILAKCDYYLKPIAAWKIKKLHQKTKP